MSDDTRAGDQTPEVEAGNAEHPVEPAGSGAGELLRDALVDDDDPRFPIWLPLPGIAATAGWALYDANVGTGAFLPALLWPGAGIFVLTTLATWLGWQLDID